MSWGSILSGIGSAAGAGGLSLVQDVSGGWSTNSAKESLNKNITKTNLKYQKEYDVWTQEQDKAYEKWYQNFLYDLQSNEYYQLARQYATNTASWAVEGLKKAGLNPVLASLDSNLSSNLGNAQPGSSSGSHSGKSVHGASVGAGGGHAANLTALAQIKNSAKQMEINQQQSKADLEVKDAQAESLRADAASKAVGNSDWGRNLASVGMLLDSVGMKKPIKELGTKAADWLIRQMGTKSEPSTGKQSAIDQSAVRRIDSVSSSPARGNVLPSFNAEESRALQHSIERSVKRNVKRYNDSIRSNNGILHLR